MSRLGITLEEVENTAEKILAAGENPTIERIRRLLGTGSNSTIAKYLHEWRSSRLLASTHDNPAPNIPPDPVHAAVNHVWEKMRTESATEINIYKEKANTEIELAQKERLQAQEARDELQQAFATLEERFNQIAADRELLALDLKAIQHERLLLQEKYQGLNNQHSDFKIQTEAVIALLTAAHQTEVKNYQNEMINIKESHEKVLNHLVESYENQRHQNIVAIDHLRVESQQYKNALNEMESAAQKYQLELTETKAQLKILAIERDSAISASQMKNQIIDDNKTITKNMDSILNEISNLKESNRQNEILLQISKMAQVTTELESLAKLIIQTIAEREPSTETAKG